MSHVACGMWSHARMSVIIMLGIADTLPTCAPRRPAACRKLQAASVSVSSARKEGQRARRSRSKSVGSAGRGWCGG
eukprot:scaffold4145_cov115-Isochrysis_galbana.AAC.22